MERTTYFLVSVAAAVVIAACGNGEEAGPPVTSTAVVTSQATPGETLGADSGALSEEAPSEGAFAIDLAAERWFRVRPGHGGLLPSGGVSPDGETIIYQDDAGLVAVRFDGTQPRRVVEADRMQANIGAAFSPDGDMLAVWDSTRVPALTLLPWPDGEPIAVDLPGAIKYGAWSDDVLAVGTGDATLSGISSIHFVSRDGTVVDVPGMRPTGYPPFAWAPREQRLAFWTYVDPNAPSSGSVVYTIEPGEAPQQLVELPVGNGGLSWSSDGSLLALRVGHPSSRDPLYVDQDVRVIDAATGDTRFTVTSAGYVVVAWSPTQSVLLLDSACGEGHQLLLVDGGGSDLRPLLEVTAGIPTSHVWSPDGRRVATTWAEESAVTAIDVESGERRTLIRGPQPILHLEWPAPDRLVLTTSDGFGICEPVLGGETRVVFP